MQKKYHYFIILFCLVVLIPGKPRMTSEGVAFNAKLSQNPIPCKLTPKEMLRADFTYPLEEIKFMPLEDFPLTKAIKSGEPKKLAEIKELYAEEIDQAAKEHGVKPSTIVAIIKVESNGNPKAVSKEGAKGLMQLMDGTAALMGVEDPFDPEENIWGGTKFFKEMHRQFGDKATALAAYNQGGGRIKNKLKSGKFNPYQLAYVKKVLSIERRLN